MAKTGAAFLQVQNAKSLADTFRVLVEASTISFEDGKRLTAFVQSQHQASDDYEELGAPDPTVYKSKSGSIVDVLNNILEDAEGQLADERKKESNSQHNYDLLKQELDDSIKFGGKELDKTKKDQAAAAETKAVAEGDLEVTKKGLAEDMAQLAQTHHECMTKAQDFELATKSRGDELKALAEAKKIILEMTGGAAGQTYSFLQAAVESSLRTRADLANFEAVKFVKNLSKKFGSAALMQLANRMSAAAKLREEVATLTKELADLEASQAQMDKVRQ